MLRKVNLLKLNFSNINKSFSLTALNKRFHNYNMSEFNNDSIAISNYPFYNKLTIKTFTKKASKRKGEESVTNEYTNNKIKKHTKKRSNEIKENLEIEKTNKSESTDLKNNKDLKEKNKTQIRTNANNTDKANNEAVNNEQKIENNDNAECLKCMIIHPVLTDR